MIVWICLAYCMFVCVCIYICIFGMYIYACGWRVCWRPVRSNLTFFLFFPLFSSSIYVYIYIYIFYIHIYIFFAIGYVLWTRSRKIRHLYLDTVGCENAQSTKVNFHDGELVMVIDEL